MTDAQRPSPADLDRILQWADVDDPPPHGDVVLLVAEVRALQREVKAGAQMRETWMLPKCPYCGSDVEFITTRSVDGTNWRHDYACSACAWIESDFCRWLMLGNRRAMQDAYEYALAHPIESMHVPPEIRDTLIAATSGNTDSLTAARFPHPFDVEEGTATC